MRARIALIVIVAFLAGCELADENPEWAPKHDYPSWAYDAPFYYRPSEDLPVAEVIAEGIPVYYTNSRSFFIKHSNGYQVAGVPRVAVWYTTDAGENWQRAGYFGTEQTHFCFQAETDGPKWVRFVGSGQGIVQAPPGQPHRIYIVDTQAPRIRLVVDPPPFEKDKEGNEVPHIYAVGETVEVSWRIQDENLDPDTVRLATTFASWPENITWANFPMKLEPIGQMRLPIPPEAASRSAGGIRVRVEARDKAGNLSYAFSDVLRVAVSDAAVEPPTPRPAAPWELVLQNEGVPAERDGWPDAGILMRGGASRILQWQPEGMAKYKNVELQFSANSGRSWRTVAENLQPGKVAKWSVPQVNSKICRLRILATQPDKTQIMLAMTRVFTVHTLPPSSISGPERITPE